MLSITIKDAKQRQCVQKSHDVIKKQDSSHNNIYYKKSQCV